MPSRQALHHAVQTEQTHVDRLYHRLGELRESSRAPLAAALAPSAGTAQAAGERDAFAATHRDLLDRYDAVESDLCFGRLDADDGSRLHIGRIGLFADDDEHTPLLTDWRAPAARPFYTATAVAPEGVRLRRTIRTRARRVVEVDDEVLAGDGTSGARADSAGGDQPLVGEAALMAALTARRTGRMTDIVRTVQAEQDAVIRSPLDGVLVVQGGPGTGKTAVALHRAAYLLFTHRRRLNAGGVLLVGPTTTFLRYISQVLPSLAETGVLALTPGELFPGVIARAAEPPVVAEIKGRAAMADVIEAAVADRQRLPDGPLDLVVDGEPVQLLPADVSRCRARARATGLPHNQARGVFARGLARLLARRVADRIGHDPFGFDPLGENDAPCVDNVFTEPDVEELAVQARREPSLRQAIARLWPLLTPQRLVAELWASPDRLAAAASGVLGERERALLVRERTDPVTGWTPDDIPLLDEAAELLGDDPRIARAATVAARRAREDELAFARGVLQVAQGSRSVDLEAGAPVLQITDVLDAEALAERQRGAATTTALQRAAADRTWTFGHVIVDEAQELSAMAWRVLLRRCPTRSMTAVGDLAQTAAAGGASSWAEVFAPRVGDRWRTAELTVCYRTPAEVMDVAAGVLARIDTGAVPPRAVREGGSRPWAARVPAAADLVTATASAVRRELAALDGGTLGVVVASSRLRGEHGFAGRVTDLVPELTVTSEAVDAGTPAVLLDVAHAKGLEFDGVLVVEPAEIVAEGGGGLRELYVALTRPTRRLGVVHAAPLPDGLVIGEAPGH